MLCWKGKCYAGKVSVMLIMLSPVHKLSFLGLGLSRCGIRIAIGIEGRGLGVGDVFSKLF